MKKFATIIWHRWLKPLLLFALLWYVFRNWLEFTNSQSIVFAFFFGACYFSFRDLDKRTEKRDDFIPYTVSVTAHNWRDLLFKYKLVKTEEEWKQLCESVKDTSVLRRGFNFTVVSLNKDGMPHLIWWDDHKIFRAGMPSFEESIAGLELSSEQSRSWKWLPRLYFGFRHGRGSGYALALWVSEDWWEKNKTPEIEGAAGDKDHLTGSLYLRLATLPYGEIGIDYERRGQDRNTELTKFGWTVKDEDIPEISDHTLEVRNDYFSVSQRDCETD